MARFAKGSRALAISDRSGAAFPYREMVKEWTGAWVHQSEFEPKQPQLEPHPVGADPQGLMHARPARVEFPVQDILPNNPFTTTGGSQTLSVSYPSNQINEGTSYVRFQSVKEIVGGVAIATLELETTLNGAINDTVNTLTLTSSAAFPNAGFIVIEKVDQDSTSATFGKYINETIQYTKRSINVLKEPESFCFKKVMETMVQTIVQEFKYHYQFKWDYLVDSLFYAWITMSILWVFLSVVVLISSQFE